VIALAWVAVRVAETVSALETVAACAALSELE
jgi:hypothetical protein